MLDLGISSDDNDEIIITMKNKGMFCELNDKDSPRSTTNTTTDNSGNNPGNSGNNLGNSYLVSSLAREAMAVIGNNPYAIAHANHNR